jgi:hypothetical protein
MKNKCLIICHGRYHLVSPSSTETVEDHDHSAKSRRSIGRLHQVLPEPVQDDAMTLDAVSRAAQRRERVALAREPNECHVLAEFLERHEELLGLIDQAAQRPRCGSGGAGSMINWFSTAMLCCVAPKEQSGPAHASM